MALSADRPIRATTVRVGSSWALPALGLLGLGLFAVLRSGLQPVALEDTFQTFATLFLGIVVEALPFLLLGVLASVAIQAFVPESTVRRLLPRGRLAGALTGGLLGFALPVCECGVVPVARRLIDKGATIPTAIAFLLAGSVVNPIVLVSTWLAFGDWRIACARVAVVFLIAVLVAVLFGFHPEPGALLARSGPDADCCPPTTGRRPDALLIAAGEEFFEMGRFLILGALAAAALRTAVPAATLTALGQGPVVSVGLMMTLAALLSICSVVDAFVALSFAGTFSGGALFAFLVFGPLIDLKSVAMFLGVFRPRTIALIVLLVAQLSFLVGVFVNLNVG